MRCRRRLTEDAAERRPGEHVRHGGVTGEASRFTVARLEHLRVGPPDVHTCIEIFRRAGGIPGAGRGGDEGSRGDRADRDKGNEPPNRAK